METRRHGREERPLVEKRFLEAGNSGAGMAPPAEAPGAGVVCLVLEPGGLRRERHTGGGGEERRGGGGAGKATAGVRWALAVAWGIDLEEGGSAAGQGFPDVRAFDRLGLLLAAEPGWAPAFAVGPVFPGGGSVGFGRGEAQGGERSCPAGFIVSGGGLAGRSSEWVIR
jgi:hypothetical protein